jgi:hypothetical protein
MVLVTDAEAATCEITHLATRAWVLSELVGAVTVAGDHERALALATDAETATREIINSYVRAQVLRKLVVAVAALEDHDRAAQLAREITDPRTRDQVLRELVGAVAVAGDQDRAARLAREITDPDNRARALSDVVLRIVRPGGGKVLHQEVAVSSLKGFLAEAISTSSWLLTLPAVAQLDPSALQATCDVLLARTNPS